MKAIGSINAGPGYEGYRNGVMVVFTEEESRAFRDLIFACKGEAFCHRDREAHSLVGTGEIDLEEILVIICQFSDIKRTANQFNVIFNEFEELVGGAG